MYFCFGTYLKTVSLCVKENVSGTDVCKALLSCFNSDQAAKISGKRSSALMNCGENISPDYTSTAIFVSKYELSQRIETIVFPLLNENEYKQLVKALQTAVSDSQINSDVLIDGMPCSDFVRQKTVALVPFLSSLLSFVIQNSLNINGKKYVERINREWLQNLDINEISVILPDFIGTTENLNLVIENEDFKSVFTEIAAQQSSILSAPNSVKCYSLNFTESGFSYSELNEFLLQNIGKYIYNRIEFEELANAPKVYSTIAAKALKKLRLHHSEGKNEIGEMLVFSFLEGALRAPKIMSRYEIEKEENTERKAAHYSSGIHLLTYKAGGKTRYQFVMGCYSLYGDIYSGIDEATEKLRNIKGNLSEKYKILNKSFFQNSFDDETAAFLKKLLAPLRPREEAHSENAFGVFIGYTPNFQVSNVESQKKALSKISEDIQKALPYIEKKMLENGLNLNSVYFYFLPFNDVARDSECILKELVE